MLGSFLPSLGLGTTKSTQVDGADAFMKSVRRDTGVPPVSSHGQDGYVTRNYTTAKKTFSKRRWRGFWDTYGRGQLFGRCSRRIGVAVTVENYWCAQGDSTPPLVVIRAAVTISVQKNRVNIELCRFKYSATSCPNDDPGLSLFSTPSCTSRSGAGKEFLTISIGWFTNSTYRTCQACTECAEEP